MFTVEARSLSTGVRRPQHGAGYRTDRLLQRAALQQSLQRRFDVRLPAEALFEFQSQPWEVRMRRDDLEAVVLKEVGLDHALLHSALSECLDGRRQLRRAGLRATELGDLAGATERLQRAHTTTNQIGDDGGDQVARQRVAVVTAVDTDRGQQDRVGADRSGGKAARPGYCAGGA